jgi:hypothetical protein
VSQDSSRQYENSTLQEKIVSNKGCSKLDLECMELTDPDMKIVAHYAIRKTKVRDLELFFLLSNKIEYITLF